MFQTHCRGSRPDSEGFAQLVGPIRWPGDRPVIEIPSVAGWFDDVEVVAVFVEEWAE